MFSFLKKKDTPAPSAAPGVETEVAPATSPAWRDRLKAGLTRTRAVLTTPLGELFSRSRIDDELLDDLETTLLMADCGVDATQWLLDELKAAVKKQKLEVPSQLREVLATRLAMLLAPLEQPLDVSTHKPFIVMREKPPPSASWRNTFKARARASCWPPATPFAPQHASSSPPGVSAMASASSPRHPAIRPPSYSMPSAPRARATSMWCWPTPPAVCPRN